MYENGQLLEKCCQESRAKWETLDWKRPRNLGEALTLSLNSSESNDPESSPDARGSNENDDDDPEARPSPITTMWSDIRRRPSKSFGRS